MDKLDIYYFLTSDSEFMNRYSYYKQYLAENAETIAGEAYSILINHTLPVEAKFITLRALRELYQEGTILMLFSQPAVL